MKLTLHHLFFCITFVLTQNGWSKNTAINDMAARSIPYALRICELETDNTRKQNMAKVLARSIFSYWYETRVLNYERVDNIDNMIKLVYKSSLQNDLNDTIPALKAIQPVLKSALKDPLDVLEKGRKLKVKKEWKFSSKEEYHELMKKFKTFLAATENGKSKGVKKSKRGQQLSFE